MAYITNELYSETTRAALPRIQPDEGPGSVIPRAFKIDAAAALLQPGCPMSVDANGQMVKLAPAGTAHATAPVAEVVFGIIWPVAVQLSATGEVLGTVMIKGQAHLVDVATAHGTAATNANFLLALRNPKTRYAGLHIDGLTLAQ